MERIPDEALVIRGGRNRTDDIRRKTGTHPSGVTGISVECALGASIEELAAAIPHGQLGCTTVIFTVDKAFLTERIGSLPDYLQEEVDEGLRMVLYL